MFEGNEDGSVWWRDAIRERRMGWMVTLKGVGPRRRKGLDRNTVEGKDLRGINWWVLRRPIVALSLLKFTASPTADAAHW